MAFEIFLQTFVVNYLNRKHKYKMSYKFSCILLKHNQEEKILFNRKYKMFYKFRCILLRREDIIETLLLIIVASK